MTEAPARIDPKPGEEGADPEFGDPEVVEQEQLFPEDFSFCFSSDSSCWTSSMKTLSLTSFPLLQSILNGKRKRKYLKFNLKNLLRIFKILEILCKEMIADL